MKYKFEVLDLLNTFDAFKNLDLKRTQVTCTMSLEVSSADNQLTKESC